MPDTIREASERISKIAAGSSKEREEFVAVSKRYFAELENVETSITETQKEHIAALESLRELDKEKLRAADARIAQWERLVDIAHASYVAAPVFTTTLSKSSDRKKMRNILAVTNGRAQDLGPLSRPTRRRRNAFPSLDEPAENDTSAVARARRRRGLQRWDNYSARCEGQQRDPTPDLKHFKSATGDPSASNAEPTGKHRGNGEPPGSQKVIVAY